MKKRLCILAILVVCFALCCNVAFAETAATGEAKNGQSGHGEHAETLFHLYVLPLFY